MPKKIQFVHLKNTKAISLSGRGCAFDCAHCNKHYLKHMDNLDSDIPENVTSLLISGGLKKDGQSFILDKKDELLDLKKKKKYKFNSHVGFVDEQEVEELAKIVDYVSFDFVSDPEVIKKVYKIEKTKEEYINMYKILSAKLPVHPHITIGIDEGKIHWEYEAIDELYKLGADRLVFNVLIPTPGTEFEGVEPPDLEEVRKVLQHARKVFEGKLVIIGCMRPAGGYRLELDKIAVEEGVDRIVQPTPKARQLAEEMGLEISNSYECCVI
jgi:lipoyl synthase